MGPSAAMLTPCRHHGSARPPCRRESFAAFTEKSEFFRRSPVFIRIFQEKSGFSQQSPIFSGEGRFFTKKSDLFRKSPVFHKKQNFPGEVWFFTKNRIFQEETCFLHIDMSTCTHVGMSTCAQVFEVLWRFLRGYCGVCWAVFCVTPGPLLGSRLGHGQFFLGHFWVTLGITLGSLLDHFWATLGSMLGSY